MKPFKIVINNVWEWLLHNFKQDGRYYLSASAREYLYEWKQKKKAYRFFVLVFSCDIDISCNIISYVIPMFQKLFCTLYYMSLGCIYIFILQVYFQSVYKFDMVAVLELFRYKTSNGKFCFNEMPELQGSAVSYWLVRDVV